MTLIHAFWFVALAVADRIAIWPLLPICLAIDSTWFSPTSFVVTWLMNTLRASGATSESIATTLMPRWAACLRAGATAFGSLPAMMIAFGFCWTIELMSGTCDDAPASVEPWMRLLPPSSFSASVDAGVLELLVRVAELLRDRDRLQALRDRGLGVGGAARARGR